MRKSKIMSLVLALCLAASIMAVPAAAAVETAGGTGTTPITVSADATTFSATVPTGIAIHVNADGSVTCPDASAVKIINNSAGPIKVTKIEMNDDAWSLVSYNGGNRSALAAAGVDSKKLGFQMKAGSDTTATASDGNQTLTIDTAQWTIGGTATGANELPITCAAIASAVSNTLASETAANVVFTLAWNM